MYPSEIYTLCLPLITKIPRCLVSSLLAAASRHYWAALTSVSARGGMRQQQRRKHLVTTIPTDKLLLCHVVCCEAPENHGSGPISYMTGGAQKQNSGVFEGVEGGWQ